MASAVILYLAVSKTATGGQDRSVYPNRHICAVAALKRGMRTQGLPIVYSSVRSRWDYGMYGLRLLGRQKPKCYLHLGSYRRHTTLHLYGVLNIDKMQGAVKPPVVKDFEIVVYRNTAVLCHLESVNTTWRTPN
jgi:hypothetical protein